VTPITNMISNGTKNSSDVSVTGVVCG
jgi:hypothetical protein